MAAATEWEKHVDDATQTPYYHNARTGETSWEAPDGFEEESANAKRPTDQAAAQVESAELPKQPRWRRFMDKNTGKPYYFDECNDVTQWDEPEGDVEDASDSEDEDGSVDDAPETSVEDGDAQKDTQLDKATSPEKPASSSTERDQGSGFPKPVGQPVEQPAHNWVKHVDKASGKPYFHDTISNTTQWETPENFTEASQTPSAVSAEYLEYLNRSRAEKLARATQKMLDPQGNLSRLNALLNKIGGGGAGSTGTATEIDTPEEIEQSLKDRARAEWQQHVDPHSQRFYYHNIVTGETQWHKPDAPVVSALADWIPPETPDVDTSSVPQPTVSGQHYATTAKFNRISGRFEKLGGEEHFLAMGIAGDREGRQMSHFFDVQQLDKNRADAKRIKEELKRKNIDWKKVAADKKAKKQKRQNEWIYQD